jgi:hypothetical protein
MAVCCVTRGFGWMEEGMMRRRNRSIGFVCVAVAVGAAALTTSVRPAAAVDGDVYGFLANVDTSSFLKLAVLQGTTYGISSGGCPHPIAPVSTYVDLSTTESGGCSVSAAQGDPLNLTACATGTIGATNWQLTEPSGDVATFTGSGVVVGGVVVMAGSPVHFGGGYSDPSSGATATGAFVGVMAPNSFQTCVGGVDSFTLDGVFVGEY